MDAGDPPTVEAALAAGAAVFNAGHHHAAHDAWEARWLGLEAGTDDERLLHGLIQYTAVVHHGHAGNWSGAAGLADSAREYLAALPADYRGVELAGVRAYLRRVGADPETVERLRAPPLRIGGAAPRLAGLDPEATLLAAPALAEAVEGVDPETVERAAAYARRERAGGGGRFLALVTDFVREPERRGLIARRLAEHVERERAREADVEGLFDP